MTKAILRPHFSKLALPLLICNLSAIDCMAKLSLSDSFLLDNLRKKEEKGVISRGNTETLTYNGIVKLYDKSALKAIEDKGATVLSHSGDLYILDMPLDSIEAISDIEGIEGLQLDREVQPELMKAKEIGDVNGVHKGEGLEGLSFDGTDVIVGLFDTGVDPNHLNFEGRVEALFHYNNNYSTEYYGEDVANFTTDTYRETHGTHVMGIMAGSLERIGEYNAETALTETRNKGISLKAGSTTLTNVANPFRGVAPGARIVVACSSALSTANICRGVEKMAKYAADNEVPAVINLSLGHNEGVHDGTGYWTMYLSEIVARYPETTVVLSAGNNAAHNEAITKENTENDLTFKTFVMPKNTTTDQAVDRFVNSSFTIQVYADNEEEFDAKLVFYSADGEVIYSLDILPEEQIKTLKVEMPYHYISGVLTASRGVSDRNNGRYTATISISELTRNQAALARMSLEVTSAKRQRIDAFLNSVSNINIKPYFTDNGLEGWCKPDGNMSINDLACANGVVAVGAMVSQSQHIALDGSVYSSGATEGDISQFSSFGKLIDGRSLPHFVAPGEAITSSYSYYYTNAYINNWDYDDKVKLVAKSNVEGVDYYWGKMSGTSMACPFAAGAFALFQQAAVYSQGRPLTTDELIDIAQSTATTDDFVKKGNPIQWGAGKLNAYNGVKRILETTSLGKVNMGGNEEGNALLYRINGRDLNVFVAGASGITLDVYGITGQRLASRSTAGCELNHSLADFGSGIYVINVATPEGGKYSKKIILR